MTNLIFPR
ncbi:hypothetical protein F383_12033 [Gossypium arboreum]|uniref:Uncharacterized protein n=1 Tax=Gossypium arboreum TaxID=29729 RepID=A0A0B0NEJ3_GOSAR|nr:hypothetical protein F383_12033 [Gossypium arboreum]